ncbi:antirestriction protein ArdA [Corynebacterium sp. 20_84]
MDAAPWGKAYVELGDDSQWLACMRWCYDVLDAAEPPEIARFKAACQGKYGSFADYGWGQYRELKPTAGMTEGQERYFNYEQWLKDLEMDYHVLPAMTAGAVWIYDARV